MINDPDKVHFNTVADLGVAIRTVQGMQQIHIGLLHKEQNEDAFVLHLRHHLDLRNELAAAPFRWLQIDLHEINRRLLVTLCRLIAARAQKIPFGFSYNGLYFTTAGDYIFRDFGQGLTCATFVMAVFATYQIDLLKVAEWTSTADDQLWQTGQASSIRSRFGTFVGDAVAQSIGHPRFRPEHVAAGAADANRPLGLNDAARLGTRIMRELERSYGGNAP